MALNSVGQLMADRRALQEQTRTDVETRGHRLHGFVADKPATSEAFCMKCGGRVTINMRATPKVNGLDGGCRDAGA